MINFKKAFTLAEIMIVLTVIGVLTAVLMPVALNSSPDEKVMKFKKGHATLGKVISELVNSDKYYLNGDLGVKADGSIVSETSYLCTSFSDVLTTKEINCEDFETKTNTSSGFVSEDWEINNAMGSEFKFKKYLDAQCKVSNHRNYVTTSDGITFFEETPEIPFGTRFE